MTSSFVPVRRGSTVVAGRVPEAVPTRFAVLGALAPWVDDATTDVLLDGAGRLWVDRGSGVEVVRGFSALTPGAARRLAVDLVGAGGRHLDDANPTADARLPGGVRVHAVLAPVSTGGALLSVRIPRAVPWRLDDLLARGALTSDDAERLRAAVRDRKNLLICGPAGSGKTALLAALLAEAPAGERIITVEDVAELAIAHPHVVGLEARQPNADGAGGITVGRLIREALRMRPDRLVLGECRGAEITDLLTAMNTGHDGGGGTVHSSGLDDLPARLEALGVLAGLSASALARQAASAIDLVVHLGRSGSVRQVVGFGALVIHDGALAVAPVPQ